MPLGGYGLALSGFMGKNHNLFVVPDNGFVGRDYNYVHVVDFPELVFFCLGCTRHSCQLAVHSEVVLEGDSSQCLGLRTNLHSLLGFDSLVESVAEPSSVHETAGELVTYKDITVFYYVVHISLHKLVGAESLHYVVDQLHFVRV